MIYAVNNHFVLETEHTGYAFDVTADGLLRHLYYGRRLTRAADYADAPVVLNQPGNVLLDGGGVCREEMLQEAGTVGWGDLRAPLAELRFPDGGSACDFRFSHFERLPAGEGAPEGLPCATGGETLKVVLRERAHPVYLELYYTVYEGSDVLGRRCRVINDGTESVRLTRLMSQQIDLPAGHYELLTFRGAWAREMEPVRQSLRGQLAWGSRAGVSSNRCNPFAMVCRRGADEDSGDVWAMNLLYSGCHLGTAEQGSFGSVRLTQGMDTLDWLLEPGAYLDSPQALCLYSPAGFGGVSTEMHPFVREHIVRGAWKDRERPVLVNSWEAAYFKISHRKAVQLARSAKEIGAELLVVDDGWFAGRTGDDRALGDWTPDRKKLPGGLAALAREITSMGLLFGLWVEPEMVSENSELFRAHPDWILGHRDQAMGRNQYVLDLTRPEVCRYICDSMKALLGSADISYIKWDMNRIMGDFFSPARPAARQGENAHRYVLGLYGILQELTEAFPQVLFESCASGGNRMDLGMLCYMPQVWASDNTDAACRSAIQGGYSYGYPQSVLGCHVSAAPNHQTLRSAPLRSRFAVASLGLLGYELDPSELPAEERQEIRQQIAWYKEHRRVLQFGALHRCPAPDGERLTMAVSPDGKEAVGVHFAGENRPNPMAVPLYARGLDRSAIYHLTSLAVQAHIPDFGSLANYMSPVRIRSGSLVEKAADKVVKLPPDQLDLTASGASFCCKGFYPVQPFGGTGFNGGTRLMKDFDSRLYLWTAEEA